MSDDHAREAADPYCITDDEADMLLAGAPWHRFAVMGDSLAAGVGDPSPGYRSASWSERLREALQRRQPVLAYLNTGAVGARAAQVRAGQLDRVLDFRPDLAAVVCGGNDLLTQVFDAESVAAEIDSIVGNLRRAGSDVITWTLQDITQAWPALAEGPLRERLRSLNDVVRKVSARHGAILVEQRDLAVCAEQDIYSRDLLHSSMRGHAVIAAVTMRQLARSYGLEQNKWLRPSCGNNPVSY